MTLSELAKAGAWANANPHAVAELAPQLGLSVWRKPGRSAPTTAQGRSTANIIVAQQKVADAFFNQKLIPKKVNVAEAVWTWQRV